MLGRLFKEEKGATAVIVALMLVVLLGFAALVVDAGVLFEQRRQLQNAVDAAALAGAQQIPFDVGQATAQSYIYVQKNGVSASEVTQNKIISVFKPNDGRGLTVKARRKVNLFFAPVLGTNFQYVEAQATAVLTRIVPQHIWPWGVPQDTLQMQGVTTLKVGSRNNVIGNFLALDFPGITSGADTYMSYVMNGFNSPQDLATGPYYESFWAETKTGNVAGPTEQGVAWDLNAPSSVSPPDLRSPIVGLVPILSEPTWDAVNGKSEVLIIGFAAFQLMGISTGPQGQAEVTGQFLQFAYGVGQSVDPGADLYGPIGARLWSDVSS